MIALLIAQFLSALADNMLLYVMLEIIQQQGAEDWQLAGLQQTFLISYIALAPFVGTVADSFPKSRVLLFANSLKFLALCFMLFGGNPYITYALVGVGASIYGPAKFGILKEIKGEAFLVKANAMVEGSTIFAILAGAVIGGQLAKNASDMGGFGSVLMLISAVYLIASISNIFIPKITPKAREKINIAELLKAFIKDLVILWSNAKARTSLIGTSLFYGVGATLRIWLVAWIPVALGMTDADKPAMFSGLVAIGVVFGSLIASFISLSNAHRVVLAGTCMGLCTGILSITTNAYFAYACLVAVGVFGGIFLVPLNAMLQKEGHNSVGGGHTIAVQNFFSNTTMLLMLGIYQLLVLTGMSLVHVGVGFAVVVVAMMIALAAYARKHLN